MIFGHNVNFVDFPFLNEKQGDGQSITVCRMSLKRLKWQTSYLPHSGREICYGSEIPFMESRGKEIVWSIHIRGVMTLMWFPENNSIGFSEEEAFTPERLRFWVYHTFLPLLFEMQERYHILHAGGVEIEGKAVLFLAPSFGGKSTLIDYLHAQGYRLLGDDSVAIDVRDGMSPCAVASYPFYRPFREPETLGYHTDAFVGEALEIASIYFLNRTDSDAEVKMEPMYGISRFKALHYGAFVPLPHLKDRIFQLQHQILQNISLSVLDIPWSKERLPDVHKYLKDII